MKKIGIITLYNNSCNYGGLLQAFALVHKLQKLNYDSMQIAVNYKEELLINLLINKLKFHGIAFLLEGLGKKIKNLVSVSQLKENDFVLTRKLCENFRENIPHTSFIKENDLKKVNEEFDVFITGSDQVWNPKWRKGAYYLQFATKKKISYAASIARYDFTNYEKKQMREDLCDFAWISVREKKALHFLKSELDIVADLVVDPTMLLSRKEWEQEEEKVDVVEKYIFCYFLKASREKRLFAQRLAKDKNMQLIYPVFVGETIRYDNENEKMLYDIGPRQWLYLINHAECVLTDSFHGTVFSIIFNKQFYHLLRDKNKGNHNMNSRIHSLLQVFGLEKQICQYSTKNTDINIDYTKINEILEIEKQKSIKLLIDALEK